MNWKYQMFIWKWIRDSDKDFHLYKLLKVLYVDLWVKAKEMQYLFFPLVILTSGKQVCISSCWVKRLFFFWTGQMLISKLEKNKAMKSEDKAEIMKTLEILTNSITKLKDELKGVSPGGGTPLKSMKTKTQVLKFWSAF